MKPHSQYYSLYWKLFIFLILQKFKNHLKAFKSITLGHFKIAQCTGDGE